MPQSKKPVGRPPRPLLEPIDDSPENMAKAILAAPPKREDEWEYLKESGS